MGYEFDPEIAPLVAAMPQYSGGTLEETRALFAAAIAALPAYEPPVPLTIVDDVVPAGEAGPAVPVRVYRPTDASAPTACIVYLHGGAFTVGSLDTEHRSAARLAAEVQTVLVSVDYRLAPEHPFPAAVDDCFATLRWVAERADDLGVDRDRIAVRGASAGGGLAAALTLVARDRGGPALCFQVLLMPELDDRLETPSMRQFVDTPMWDRGRAEVSWMHYLGTAQGGADVSPYAAPARARDLAGLPAAYVSVCEFDPLRDEGITYAQRLVQAGVHTELHLVPGTFHGSTQFEDVEVTRRMHADEIRALRRALFVQ
ncbi:MAG TPA: alpha/beta hydrolase [Acidimicrobiia bacterium]